MFRKSKFAVKEEAKVPPVLLGFKRGIPCERGNAQVYGWIGGLIGPGKVEYFSLVMFNGKTKSSKKTNDKAIGYAQCYIVFLEGFTLCDDGTIINIGNKGAVTDHGFFTKGPHSR